MSSTFWALPLIKISLGNLIYYKDGNQNCEGHWCTKQIKTYFPPHLLLTIYNSLIQPHLIYGLYLWGLNCKRQKILKKKQLESSPFAHTYHILPQYLKL